LHLIWRKPRITGYVNQGLIYPDYGKIPVDLTRAAGEIIDFHDFSASLGANLFHPALRNAVLFCIKKRAWKGALHLYGIKRSDQ